MYSQLLGSIGMCASHPLQKTVRGCTASNVGDDDIASNVHADGETNVTGDRQRLRLRGSASSFDDAADDDENDDDDDCKRAGRRVSRRSLRVCELAAIGDCQGQCSSMDTR
jgi:hypothetical protein